MTLKTIIPSRAFRAATASPQDWLPVGGALPSAAVSAMVMRSAPQPMTSLHQAQVWKLYLPPLLLPVHLSTLLTDLHSLAHLSKQGISSKHLQHFHFELRSFLIPLHFIYMVPEGRFRSLSLSPALGWGRLPVTVLI